MTPNTVMTPERRALMPSVLRIIGRWQRESELRAQRALATNRPMNALLHAYRASHYQSVAIGLASRDDFYLDPYEIYRLVKRALL